MGLYARGAASLGQTTTAEPKKESSGVSTNTILIVGGALVGAMIVAGAIASKQPAGGAAWQRLQAGRGG